jgi:hypothetical protein
MKLLSSLALLILSLFSFSANQKVLLLDVAGIQHKISLDKKKNSLEVRVGTYRLIQKLDENGKLISERSDKDGNGIFEFEGDYSKPNLARLQYDDNQDSHFERVETRWISKEKTDALIDTFSKDGKRISRRFVVARPHSSPTTDCAPQPGDYAFLKSNRALGALLDEARIISRDDTWAITSFGVKVHNSCLQADLDFLNILQSSWADGLACMNRLGGRGSQEQVAKAAALLANQENPPKVNCLLREDSIGGKATIPGQNGHPEISVNIVSPQSTRENLKSILLHELMHNCGQVHGSDVEYAYNCPKCCFERPQELNSRALRENHQMSCEVCKGDFQSVNDPEYISRMRRMHTVSPDPGTDSFLRSSLYTTDLPLEDRLLNFMLAEQHNFKNPALYRALYQKLKHRTPELEAEGVVLVNPDQNVNFNHSSEFVMAQARKAIEALEAYAKLDGEKVGKIYQQLSSDLSVNPRGDRRVEREKSLLLKSLNDLNDDFLSYVNLSALRKQ